MTARLSGARRVLGAAATLIALYLLGPGAAAAPAGAERLYVSDEWGGYVVVVDPGDARVVTRIPVEVLTWRVTVSARPPHLNLKWPSDKSQEPAHKGTRQAFFPELGSYVSTPVYRRYALRRRSGSGNPGRICPSGCR